MAPGPAEEMKNGPEAAWKSGEEGDAWRGRLGVPSLQPGRAGGICPCRCGRCQRDCSASRE